VTPSGREPEGTWPSNPPDPTPTWVPLSRMIR